MACGPVHVVALRWRLLCWCADVQIPHLPLLTAANSLPQMSTAMSEARAAVTAHMEALRMRSSSTQSGSTAGAGSSAPASRQQSQDAGPAQVPLHVLPCAFEGVVCADIRWHAACVAVMLCYDAASMQSACAPCSACRRLGPRAPCRPRVGCRRRRRCPRRPWRTWAQPRRWSPPTWTTCGGGRRPCRSRRQEAPAGGQ